MRNPMIAATLPLLFVAAIAAQEPQKPQDPQTPPRTPTAAAQEPAAKLTGCLYREEQVPGRTPNPAERAGVLEDYILVQSSADAPKGAAPAATGTSGMTAKMYKVEGPSDEKLKALVGKRVEVSGRIDTEAGAKPGQATPDRGVGPDKVSLSEIEATSIREISGTCPATPAAGK